MRIKILPFARLFQQKVEKMGSFQGSKCDQKDYQLVVDNC